MDMHIIPKPDDNSIIQNLNAKYMLSYILAKISNSSSYNKPGTYMGRCINTELMHLTDKYIQSR